MKWGITIPQEVAVAKDLRPAAKALYLVAMASRPKSISEIARAAGVDRGYATRVCAAMTRAGWMKMVRSGRDVRPVPVIPYAVEEQRAKVLSVVAAMANFKGEFLMKCWLDLLVASTNVVDNARPGFLSNPMTGEPLELDRYYLEGVGFEFNGEQHYGTTQSFPSEDAFKQQRTRDLLKKALSLEKKIVLVEVRKADLSLENMEAKIPDMLPKLPVDVDSPYVKALSRISREYRSKGDG